MFPKALSYLSYQSDKKKPVKQKENTNAKHVHNNTHIYLDKSNELLRILDFMWDTVKDVRKKKNFQSCLQPLNVEVPRTSATTLSFTPWSFFSIVYQHRLNFSLPPPLLSHQLILSAPTNCFQNPMKMKTKVGNDQ